MFFIFQDLKKKPSLKNEEAAAPRLFKNLHVIPVSHGRSNIVIVNYKSVYTVIFHELIQKKIISEA
jgi:hypothetical protein